MSWLVEDRKGEVHEIDEDERVLVIGRDENYSRNWLLDAGLPPFGTMFTVPSGWRAIMRKGNWAVLIWLEGWEFSSEAEAIKKKTSELELVKQEIFA